MKRDESPLCSTIAAAEAAGMDADAIERRVWEEHGTRCAMLALDSSGMTRVSRDRGIVYFLSRYMRMRDLAVSVLERNQCLAWRSFADNLFAEFAEPAAAVASAIAIHAALREADLRVNASEPYRVCIGIGYGRVLQNGKFGVMGDEMNVVAKLAEDIAEAGETLVTEAAFRAQGASLATAERIETTISQTRVTYYRLRG